MKKKTSLIVCGTVGFVAVIVFIWYFTSDFTFETTDITAYKNTGKVIENYSKTVMPDLNTLFVYDEINYKLSSDDLHSHYKYVEYLNVVYDSDTYLYARRQVNLSHTFLENVVTDSEGNYLIPQPSFRINEYKFKVVGLDAGGLSEYPKFFGMIATNDAKCSVTYIYFYNEKIEDIPYGSNINETMADFVRENCSFDFDK